MIGNLCLEDCTGPAIMCCPKLAVIYGGIAFILCIIGMLIYSLFKYKKESANK